MVKVVEFANDLPLSCDLEQGKIVVNLVVPNSSSTFTVAASPVMSSDATVQLGLVFGGKPAPITSPT
ncbi:hypothetical protein NLY43_13875 [Mesorhizobium sp. C416B]|nr:MULTISPECIES: hypothetical protein [unclassified Mesorhizobium]ESX42066.1 hypothetical protein X761_33360 [Mesorhizobium sp. LSHC424B00]ESX64339.1 hypothetical protein X758_31695 [Mesorhizobium sp. LSHC416B00]WJI65667.1 hypothetical protein NLY43_13875 [Mesorhizobium sp. C416B]